MVDRLVLLAACLTLGVGCQAADVRGLELARPRVDAGSGGDGSIVGRDDADGGAPRPDRVDTGVPDRRDTGVPDRRDTGVPDRRDTGVRDVPEPSRDRGTEGQPCTAASTCDPGLTCIEWPASDPATPIRTCVLACEIDAECRASARGHRSCRPFSAADLQVGVPAPQIGVIGICVGAEAGAGQACVGSRRGGDTVTGCATPLDCVTHFVGDERGTCAELCTVTSSDGASTCGAQVPHCNPGASGITITRPDGVRDDLGVCAVRPIKQGERCSTTDPRRSCDLSTQTVIPGNQQFCVAFPDLPPDEGICVETCARNGGTCSHDEPGLGRALCRPYTDEGSDPLNGLCVDACSSFPESCGGPGALGAGRSCSDTWTFDAQFPVSFCVDRGRPPLAEAVLQMGADGTPMLGMFEDCRPGFGGNGDAYRCPEGTHCFTLTDGMPSQGACVRGCDTTSTSSTAGTCAPGTQVCQSVAGGTEGLCTSL